MMRTRPSALWPLLTFAGATLLTVAGAASGEVIQARLIGYEETPLAISSPGSGTFTARIDRSGTSIEYTLQYDGLQGKPFMAHIHFGKRHVGGGISVWLCGNPEDGGTGPMGTPACPVPGGTVTGVINAASVVGPAGQLIAPGELGELIEAIRAGATYANVHTTAASGGIPSGEIRGQIHGHDNDHGHDH